MHQIADAVDVEDDEILAVGIDDAFELADHRCRHLQRRVQHHALPVMRMRHGDGERVGGVVRRRVGLGQQHADHHPHLRLVAVAGADDAFLHQVRRVFGDRHAGSGRHHHGDAARLAELERRSRVLVDEGRLDRRLVGPEFVENAHQARHGWRAAASRASSRSLVVTEPQPRKPKRCRQSRPCPSRCGGARDRCRGCELGASCQFIHSMADGARIGPPTRSSG